VSIVSPGILEKPQRRRGAEDNQRRLFGGFKNGVSSFLGVSTVEERVKKLIFSHDIRYPVLASIV